MRKLARFSHKARAACEKQRAKAPKTDSSDDPLLALVLVVLVTFCWPVPRVTVHLSMEKLRQTRSRADQEEHAPFYVQCEAMEKILQAERPCSCEFDVLMNQEVGKVNSHVVACLGVLESASPASENELVRCSSKCGSLINFIHCNRNALREIAKEFNEKMRNATWACCTRFSMRTIEDASFCTSLLERVLNVQERVLNVQEEGGGDSSLRRLLTEVYEVAAGLSESPSFRGIPKAPAAPRMPSMPISPRSIRPARTHRASMGCAGPARAKHALSSRASRLHRPRTADLPPVCRPRGDGGSANMDR